MESSSWDSWVPGLETTCKVNVSNKMFVPKLMVRWCEHNCEKWDFGCNYNVTVWTFYFDAEEDKVKFILKWL